MKVLDLTALEYPKNLAFLSYNVRRLKPGKSLKVKGNPEGLKDIKRWCEETGNLLKVLSCNLAEIQRGKGFHGVCLNEKLSFYFTGAKLHIKEHLLKFFGKYPPYLFNFVSLKEGLKGIRILKREGFEFEVLPSPKEIESYCGFAVGFKNLKSCEFAFRKLLEERVGVETLFRRNGKGFEILKRSWEI